MEASNKIVLLRHSHAEINVRVYESYKAVYAKNPPLDETGDVSHCSLDSTNLFVEQRIREGLILQKIWQREKIFWAGRPPVPPHPRPCRTLHPLRQPPSTLAGELWLPLCTEGLGVVVHLAVITASCSPGTGDGAGLQHPTEVDGCT